MGSDESHLNGSVGNDGQSDRTVSTNHNLFEEEREPKRYRTEVFPLTQPNALQLGQTGSQVVVFLLAREPRTPTSTFTQLLSSEDEASSFFNVALRPQVSKSTWC